MTPRPLRIASVAYWNAFVEDGVARKLGGQVEAWRLVGTDARLFVLSPGGPAGAEAVVGDETFTFASPLGRISATRALVQAVRRYEPDAVYLRYDLFLPPLDGSAFGGAPLVVELNTLDRVELRGRSTRARLYNRVNRTRTLGSAAGLVGMTGEIVEDTLAGRPGLPAAVVANGVDPRGIPSVPAPTNSQPRLCFLGSPGMRWHGVDKLVALARLRPDWKMDVIGFSAAELGDLPGNVTAHGYLGREQYLPILATADAAVGTLALHRKGMEEACPLKLPEYLLSGIPTIIGYRDANFLDVEPWYLLRLPNDEDNVARSVDRIEQWLERVRGRRVPRAEVEPRVALAWKEAQRLAFVREIALGALGGGGERLQPVVRAPTTSTISAGSATTTSARSRASASGG
jgi:hypothetical protein